MSNKRLICGIVEMAFDAIVFICAFKAFPYAIALLIFAAYCGIGACIDRNFANLRGE